MADVVFSVLDKLSSNECAFTFTVNEERQQREEERQQSDEREREKKALEKMLKPGTAKHS